MDVRQLNRGSARAMLILSLIALVTIPLSLGLTRAIGKRSQK